MRVVHEWPLRISKSSKILDRLIFGHFRKMIGNICVPFARSSEMFASLRKIAEIFFICVVYVTKREITWQFEDMNFIFWIVFILFNTRK